MSNINAPRITGNIGTRLLFENDRVRVWDLRLEPGGSTGVHRHENDYLYVVIGDGALQTVYSDGTRDPPRQMFDGDVRFREVDGEAIHEAINVGDAPWRNIVVELKR
jgi:beta-alanine degradation protein BauB